MAVYAARADIEAMFGTINVQQWANLDSGDVLLAAVLTDIAARITLALADASAEVDDTLRDGPYVLPFDASPNAPILIKRITVQLAGVQLYEARGIDEAAQDDPDRPRHRLAGHRRQARNDLKRIKFGSFRLDVTRTTQHPEAVIDDE